MKKVLVTFGGKAYDLSIAKTAAFLENTDIELRVYDDAWLLQTDFHRINRWIFEAQSNQNHHIGFGWCSWKPYIILEELKRLQYGDIVLYVDADTHPIADLTPLFDIAARDGMCLFCELADNKRFTKRDCFIAMAQDTPEAYSALHSCGRFQLFQKGHWLVEQLLMEWLTYSLNPLCQVSDFRIGDRGPSKYGVDLPEFHRHSGEQSVLTLLAHKFAIPLHRVPCQYGWPRPKLGFEQDTYVQLFHQQYCEGDRRDVSGSRYRNV